MAKLKALPALLLLLALAWVPGAGSAMGQSFKVQFRQFKLDNGLRVVLSEDHNAPVVAVAVYYDVGSRNEVKGRSGFAHLFEHMMFQGSENVGKAEHFKYVESNGGYLNGSTHDDFTNYFEFLPSNQLELALWLESDRMKSLKITPENLKNQQDAVKEEKRLRVDNQAYWPALLQMNEMLYSNWSNSHSTIGSMQDLDAATVADVRQFFDTYYAPNNAVLVICGDVDQSQAEALVRKYFATIPQHRAPSAVDVSEPFDSVKAKAVVDDPHAQVPAIAMGWKVPARRTPDFYAVSLLKSIMLDGESSRLYQKLVKDKQVVLQIEGEMDERRGPSSVAFYALHSPDVKSEDVQALIEQELEQVRKDGVTADELAKIKNQYRLGRFLGAAGDEYSSLQTALGRALALGQFGLFDNDPGLVNTEIDQYLAVTQDQVREAARKYFGTANRSVMFIRAATREAPVENASAPKAEASSAVVAVGTWNIIAKLRSQDVPIEMDVKQDGAGLSATVHSPAGDIDFKGGTLQGNLLMFDTTVTINGADLPVKIKAAIEGNSMKGTAEMQNRNIEFTGTRK